MASANSILSPQSHFDRAGMSPHPPVKRKRAESHESGEKINGMAGSNVITSLDQILENSQQQIDDFIEVLKSHDTSTSVLSRQLPARESSAEPQPKRKKSESDSNTFTIITRAASGGYSSLEDIVSDINATCLAMLEELNIPNGAARTQFTPIPTAITELASKIKIFRTTAEHVLWGEKAYRMRKSSLQPNSMDDAKSTANGTLLADTVTHLNTGNEDNKLVLTLYGNAPGAKQLFSSLQQPVTARDGSTHITQPLREAGLPNGISTTQIVPLQTSGLVEEKKRAPTMGELFTSSGSAIPFQPPKPSPLASTRSSHVGWYQPTGLDNSRSRSSQSYFSQNITSGEWLDYTGTSPPLDAKRKQRERALSLGGAKVSASSANSAEQENSKLDALFRSAYSSFAPVKDDAAAIVPEGTMNHIWWQRVGEKSFDRLMKSAATLESGTSTNLDSSAADIIENQNDGTDQVEEFREAVDEWDPLAVDPNLDHTQSDPKSIDDKAVEEILQEISELLETLNSYQRIRNLTLNPLPRSGGTSSAADPTKPTEAEVATYNTLKSQLALMIAMLPPYAVAKLNSDQLAELNISTKIQVLTDNYKGVMEEDEVAARAKVAEMRAATSSRPAPSASLHRSSSSLYGNQYSSTARPAIPSGQQYYSQSQTPVRSPSANIQRMPNTVPAPYPGHRPSTSTPYRPQSNYSTPTYPHQLPRTSQSQYGPSNAQQYFQTPTASSYGSAPASNPQASLSARYQNSVQAAYQQSRSQTSQTGMDYRYSNGSVSNRQSSPQNSSTFGSQPQIGQTQARPFSTPSASQDHRYFQSPMVNGTSAHTPQPQVSQQHSQSGALGATGYHTVMTAEQQSTMMERQRAQLAQQQGTQQHARNVAQAGAMSVSPGPQINGGSAVTAGL